MHRNYLIVNNKISYVNIVDNFLMANKSILFIVLGTRQSDTSFLGVKLLWKLKEVKLILTFQLIYFQKCFSKNNNRQNGPPTFDNMYKTKLCIIKVET